VTHGTSHVAEQQERDELLRRVEGLERKHGAEARVAEAASAAELGRARSGSPDAAVLEGLEEARARTAAGAAALRKQQAEIRQRIEELQHSPRCASMPASQHASAAHTRSPSPAQPVLRDVLNKVASMHGAWLVLRHVAAERNRCRAQPL
jgi:hypothetical protein